MFYIFILFYPLLYFHIDFLHSWTSQRATAHKRTSSLCLSLVLWSVEAEQLKVLYGWEIERM